MWLLSDHSNKLLESANIIAKPLQEKASLKFAIADKKGRYRLEFDKVDIKSRFPIIGFMGEMLFLEPNSVLVTYDFKRKPNGEELKKIVIKHEFKPIIIKKYTLIFTFKSFANRNERKIKNMLEKRPIIDVVKDYEII